MQAPCHYCGNLIDSSAQFCSRCGSTVNWTPPSAVDPSPHQERPYQQPYQQPYRPPPHQGSYQPPPYNQPYYQGARDTQPYHQPPGYPAPQMMPVYIERKDRNTAILLAIFLGPWTWVYTYRKDAWKFWLNFVLNLTLFNPFLTIFILLIPNICLYIWAIVDVAAKPQQFYDNYPFG